MTSFMTAISKNNPSMLSLVKMARKELTEISKRPKYTPLLRLTLGWSMTILATKNPATSNNDTTIRNIYLILTSSLEYTLARIVGSRIMIP